MSRRANPFKPGAGTMPPYLAGRETERKRFLLMLRDVRGGRGGNMLVHGLRGMGKTVLMEEFERMCGDENILPVVESQYSRQHSNPSLFVNQLKYNMRTAIETFSKLEKTRSKVQYAVRYTKPTGVRVPRTVYHEPPYDAGSGTPLHSYMTDYLIENWDVVETGGYDGVVFLFDEFHTVRNSKRRGWSVLSDFIGAMNEVQMEGYRYAAVLCGLPPIQSNINAARSYSERMFRPSWVSVLDDADAITAMTKPLEEVGRSFSREVLASIARETGGYPYFIQFCARKILDRVDGNSVGMRDWRRVKVEITAQLDRDFFDQRMTEITDGQRTTLDAMSNVEGPDITFADVKKYAGISSGTFAKNAARFVETGIIHSTGRGVYRFTIPLFQDYLRRQQEFANGPDPNG